MSKKKLFQIKVSKLLISITRGIESFFNFLKHSNINKKKYFNVWKKSIDKKFFISLMVIFLSIIGYFLLPAFYDQNKIKSELKSQILNNYNLEVEFDDKPKFGLFPKPHYLIENFKIRYNSEILSNSKYVKLFISKKNNFEFNKIKLENLFFLETDFRLNNKNFNFFSTLLSNKFLTNYIRFKNNKLFYLDENGTVIFFSEIKNLKYLYEESLINKLIAKLEIFNLPISLKIDHNLSDRNVFSEVKLDTLKLKIENSTIYNSKELEGELDLNYLNKNQMIKYNLRNDILVFNSTNKEFTGEINIVPFFLLMNLNLNNISVKQIIGNNSALINLFKSEILNNKNLNGKINLAVDGLNDIDDIDKVKIEIKFEEGEIYISNINFKFQNSIKFNLNNISLILDENKLKFIGDVVVEFIDIQNFYNHFQIKRNYRNNIDIITSDFIFKFDDGIFEMNELIIKGANKQISDQYVSKFDFGKKNLFNKVIFRNTIRDFFKSINLD